VNERTLYQVRAVFIVCVLGCLSINQSVNKSEIFNVARIAKAISKSTITWLVMSDDDVVYHHIDVYHRHYVIVVLL